LTVIESAGKLAVPDSMTVYSRSIIMSRVQLALRVADLEASVAFYTTLLGAEPAKRRPGYANFAIAEPPLKLVLLEGEPGQRTALDHLGVEVASTEEVTRSTERLSASGLLTDEQHETTCCYAVQDKVWVHGPGQEPWEVYVVKADSPTYGTDPELTAATCCADTETPVGASGCC
jgi:catechol 2,3-dioxygenase-like lactoylglutathione lyase family enzyme